MIRRLSSAITVLASLWSALTISAFGKASAPDIILVTADDLGLQLGCYGDNTIPTPGIDALSKEGVRFTRAYVTSALCSPSRSSILTGLYPHETGQFGLSNEYSMRNEIPNLTDWLGSAGYHRVIFGKLHVRPEDDFHFESRYAKKFYIETLDVKAMAADVREALASAGDKSSFLYINYFDPHRNPMAEKGRGFVNQYKGYPQNPISDKDVKAFPFQGFDTLALRKDIAGYYNSIARLDVGIGLLVRALKEQGKWDNSLVIFIGDNGPDFTRAKATCYEAGLQVPLLIKFPKGHGGGSSVDSLVSAVDLVPTILAVAGISIPENLPGMNLELLVQTGKSPGRDYLFGEATATRAKKGLYPMRSVNDGQYKLIHNLQYTRENPLYQLADHAADALSTASASASVKEAFARLRHPPEFELYNLRADPWEYSNLSGDSHYSEKLETLKDHLANWQQRTGDPITDKTESREIEVLPKGAAETD